MRYFIIEQLISFILFYFVKVFGSEKLCSVMDTPFYMSNLALRTVSSDGVFEGRPLQTLVFQPRDSGLTQWNISFFVVTVYKGKTIPVSATVVVDVMDGTDFVMETNASCLLSKTPNNDLYVVFVNQSLSPSERFFFSSGSFVRSSDQVIQQVKDYACGKCGEFTFMLQQSIINVMYIGIGLLTEKHNHGNRVDVKKFGIAVLSNAPHSHRSLRMDTCSCLYGDYSSTEPG